MQLPNPRYRIASLPHELRHVNGFHHLQTYFPALSKLYRLSKHQSQDVWLDSRWRIRSLDCSGTSGPCRLQVVPNVDISGEAEAATPESRRAFLKVTHLLDPTRWMQGEYSLPKEPGLPWHGKTWTRAWNKLQDPWNQAYVESIASYALGRLREEGASPHFNTFYGAFCARADTYRYNLTDEFGSYRNARWFWHGQKKGLFSLKLLSTGGTVEKGVEEQLFRQPSDESLEGDSKSGGSSSDSEEEVPEEELAVGDIAADDTASLKSGGLSELSFASASDSDSEEADDTDGDSATSGTDSSDSADEYRIYAEIKNYPVMMIVVEENQGTMDSLLEDIAAVGAKQGTADWDLRWSAWLFQVIAALSVAQAVLGFTHNDLHTNNVVWTETQEEFFYYTTRAGQVFKVPTFGRLFRLIDFGRSIFRINDQHFISDDFKAGNDADGQYSFKPLHPRPANVVEPNPSFDLCRLAVSMFEALFPDAPEDKEGGAVLSSEPDLEVKETVSPLYNMLWSWLIDDEGRNVLIEPDGEERFPDFDLYKHIAEHVHTAVPALQFTKPALDRFQVAAGDVPADVRKWSLFV
jgi:hypothetical protein